VSSTFAAIHFLAYWTLLPLLAVAAWVWGGRIERWASGIVLTGSLLTLAVRRSWPVRYQQVEIGLMLVDLAVLAVLAWLLLKDDRWWLRILIVVHTLASLAALAKAIDPRFQAGGYAVMTSSASWPILLCLTIGILQHHRRATALRTSRGSSLPAAAWTRTARPPG
jgi:hypothetical protein